MHREHCVLGMAVCCAFLWVGSLPSTTSSAGLPLFGGFLGTMDPCDFPAMCASALRFVAFSDRPDASSPSGIAGISRFPCKELPHMRRAFDSAEPFSGSPFAPPCVSPSDHSDCVGSPDL